MIAKLKKRRLRKTAKAVAEALESQYGKKKLYSDEELDFVCTKLNLNEDDTVNAYGMFAEETACDGFLTKVGASKTARELRMFLAGQMFDGTYTVDYDSLWNRFHDFDNQLAPSSPSTSSGGGWFSGAGDDGDFDSGAASGGDGGGD